MHHQRCIVCGSQADLLSHKRVLALAVAQLCTQHAQRFSHSITACCCCACACVSAPVRLCACACRHLTHIKVDWDKWVDSDDEEDNFDPSSMDMSSMAGLGGGGGMGGLANMMGGGMRMPGMGMMPGMMGGGGAGMPGAADLQQMLAGLGAGGAGLGAMGGGLGNMNFEDMGAGGIGDTAGVDDDSDDEDLPELEA